MLSSPREMSYRPPGRSRRQAAGDPNAARRVTSTASPAAAPHASVGQEEELFYAGMYAPAAERLEPNCPTPAPSASDCFHERRRARHARTATTTAAATAAATEQDGSAREAGSRAGSASDLATPLHTAARPSSASSVRTGSGALVVGEGQLKSVKATTQQSKKSAEPTSRYSIAAGREEKRKQQAAASKAARNEQPDSSEDTEEESEEGSEEEASACCMKASFLHRDFVFICPMRTWTLSCCKPKN
ncbi:hypothetical protein FA09DRAFT_125038 [Tilletiopsis washingtonensis]|uniref:Uncharacterized protein n=1 Tax=Tilletiopsis washingtonensis TaxID=58919 RepID=A0A316Z1V8_9BASI|nr:hypothetical protein FA09DRAFT_125038 [Tilletiopsis washingtonensis]PWN95767.1 hypothetical protein FA09DRAFT_125038 [Tilletiopsis washingtonensis]